VAPGQTVYIPVKRANQSPELGVQIPSLTSSTLSPYVYWQSVSGLVTAVMDNASGCLKVTASSTATTAGIIGGNAEVGVTTGTGTPPPALWSWHVWVTNYNPTATSQTMNSVVWMDRNLGALAVAGSGITFDQCGGLLYQWGRKDPFPGPADASGTEPTIYNGTTTTSIAKTAVPTTTSATYYNLTNAIQNPATYYTSSSGNQDWYAAGVTAQKDNLWGSTKTVYDPCPTGWKVPANTAWTTTGWTTSTIPSSGSSYNSYATWNSNGVIAYYPAQGIRNINTGAFGYVGTGGIYWSSIVSSTIAYDLFLRNISASSSDSSLRGNGFSVRCIKE